VFLKACLVFAVTFPFTWHSFLTKKIMQDPSPVQDKGPPKSITVEDSFKDCSSLPAAQHVIKVLAPDLLARMVEDYQVCPWQRHFHFARR
jgi:hypothetical protein